MSALPTFDEIAVQDDRSYQMRERTVETSEWEALYLHLRTRHSFDR